MTDEEKSATFVQQGTLHTAQPQLSAESGGEEDLLQTDHQGLHHSNSSR